MVKLKNVTWAICLSCLTKFKAAPTQKCGGLYRVKYIPEESASSKDRKFGGPEDMGPGPKCTSSLRKGQEWWDRLRRLFQVAQERKRREAAKFKKLDERGEAYLKNRLDHAEEMEKLERILQEEYRKLKEREEEPKCTMKVRPIVPKGRAKPNPNPKARLCPR